MVGEAAGVVREAAGVGVGLLAGAGNLAGWVSTVAAAAAALSMQEEGLAAVAAAGLGPLTAAVTAGTGGLAGVGLWAGAGRGSGRGPLPCA